MKFIDSTHLILNAKHDGYVTMYEITREPEVDPIHAMGACYCKECKHYFYSSFSNDHYCDCPLGVIGYAITTGNDFCSRGERKE